MGEFLNLPKLPPLQSSRSERSSHDVMRGKDKGRRARKEILKFNVCQEKVEEIQRLREQIAAITASMSRYEKDIVKPVKADTRRDWDDAEDVAIYRRDRYRMRSNRLKFIDKYCPDHKCMKCGTLVIDPAHLRIVRLRHQVLCRMCDGIRRAEKTGSTFVEVQLGEESLSYVIDGAKLKELRQMVGLSLRAFAKAINCDFAYLSRIENESVKTIAADRFDLILYTLKKYGVTTLDSE